MVPDPKIKALDEWLETDRGRYVFSRQKKLILDLISPISGEAVLGVGCGAGHYLQLFQEKLCMVTGVDSSAETLKLAASRLGDQIELIFGEAEDLPFSDNEFDIVTLINVLEAANDPEKVVAEAIRVSRRRVFIGFINSYSFAGTRQSLKELFGFPLSINLRFFDVFRMKSIVEKSMNPPAIHWGSVINFPGFVYDFFSELEEVVPRNKNPLGAFVGMTFPVKYIYRTVQTPIMETFDLKAKSTVAPEAMRGMFQERKP
jgi:SAM-dependent methyltransferase